MRVKLNLLAPLLGICIFWWGVGYAWSAPIQYKQTMTKILDETQFQGWPPDYETWARYFNLLTCSPDGSRIAFRVETLVGTTYVRAYAANSDGSGLIDLTGHFPPEVDPLWTAVNYQLDDTGSRLFFRAPNVGSDFNFYYFNLATLACNLAVLPKGGETYAIHYLDGGRPFSLTTIGGQITLYFRHREGWDPEAERYIQGIYGAPLGGFASKVMDINQVPGDQNMNLLGFQGSAANANQILFTWNNVNIPGWAMWKVAGPTRVPNELYDLIWGGVHTHTISADGGKALYIYRNLPPTTSYLCQVDLASGIKTLITQTNELESYFVPTMAPSGNYAFFSSPFNRRTRANLATGEQRDTLSYYFSPCTGDYLVSDITADDRYYFIGGKCGVESLGRIHRIDMAPTDFSRAPNISAIDFTSAWLRNDGTTTTTVMATVSDAQGLGTIAQVRLQSLVDGLEGPEWLLGAPLFYDSHMYDDGTHGDQVAGDGIFTNDTIKTNPSSNFYERYALPRQVGIRIVAQDEDYNYVLADTYLTVGTNLILPSLPLLLLD